MEPQPKATAGPCQTIYRLASILERIELADLFSTARPLEIELGSGDGSFLVAYAAQHPDRNFIGVERLLGRIRKLDRKTRRAGLDNLRGIRIESAYFLRFLLAEHSASAIHIYFPDPWPKRKHRRHRLVNEAFPALAARALRPAGLVYLRTDDADYFQQMTEVFGGSPLFVPVETPNELQNLMTDFEKDFQEKGVVTRRVAYQALGAV